MNKPYLLTGSLAFDTILRHEGSAFHERIAPDQLHRLNVSFGIDRVDEQDGGTGGNIAFNSALLKDVARLVCTTGSDSQNYVQKLDSFGVDMTMVQPSQSDKTAHAYILTDANNNQISSFYPGALTESLNTVYQKAFEQAISESDLWHIAPDDSKKMIEYVKLAKKYKCTYFFDPGQSLANLIRLDKQNKTNHLQFAVQHAKGIFVNDYEMDLLIEGLGLNNAFELLTSPQQFIVKTRGSEGSEVYMDGEKRKYQAWTPKRIEDPTGCGDALRAGFIHGWLRGLSMEVCINLGSYMGALAIGHLGGQNHLEDFDPEIIEKIKTSRG